MAWPWARRREGGTARSESSTAFGGQFEEIFAAHFQRLVRYVSRLSGDPELAADVVQEAFVRLYRRGSLPDSPAAWLVSVAMNLFRNEVSKQSRRRRLLSLAASDTAHSGSPASFGQAVAAEDSRRRVRAALDQLPERERSLLLLRAEGYKYRDIAAALGLHEASVGVLLARARQAFRKLYGDAPDAS